MRRGFCDGVEDAVDAGILAHDRGANPCGRSARVLRTAARWRNGDGFVPCGLLRGHVVHVGYGGGEAEGSGVNGEGSAGVGGVGSEG